MVTNKKRSFGQFEQQLQILVLILCCYEWKIKDLTYPYTPATQVEIHYYMNQLWGIRHCPRWSIREPSSVCVLESES